MLPFRLSVTNALIVLCAVVFFVGLSVQQPAILGVPLSEGDPESICEILGACSYYTAILKGQLWRLITYQFVHANMGHLLFNMWALYFFGPAVEHVFGPKKFLLYYFTCGIAGALCSVVLAGTGLYMSLPDTLQIQQLCQALATQDGYDGLVLPWQMVPLVGASASIYGVMIATAFLYPEVRIQLIFPPIPMKLRTFALGVIGIAAVTILFNLSNAGGEAGHLGGIVMGALIMTVRQFTHRADERLG